MFSKRVSAAVYNSICSKISANQPGLYKTPTIIEIADQIMHDSPLQIRREPTNYYQSTHERLFSQHKPKKSYEQCRLELDILEARKYSFSPQIAHFRSNKSGLSNDSRRKNSPNNDLFISNFENEKRRLAIQTSQNLYQQATARLEKRKELHSKKDIDKIAACTFTPRVNTKRNDKLLKQKPGYQITP